ncbi:type III secretion system inner membrane ring subunit SctD [Nitratidesulfovibrio vulgaris]|uniref:Type III secretion apparatus protein, YscD/HrpQ family n=1 Tax=Nitratidesulfovibrio vulgaris (strain DP4) TaxID=391774 RepID=A0A0H3ABL3_NITV4|nr:type III secretion system inner membrane ring subunit SctD [Nitratidesulfovibrio vulgaris]ABM30007.1 type III secretion apparatus protein, YscD/HrpQ family [Nitratidesulfovibrio vulgaris DP4]
MSSSGDIILRVFSGPHTGAEVVLPPGDHVIGTEDSCDIILSDGGLAPRHVSIGVTAGVPGAPSTVRITPLDGPVRYDDAEVPATGVTLAPATPCHIGETCLAWNTPGAPWETFDLTPRQSVTAAEGTPQATTSGGTAQGTPAASASASPSGAADGTSPGLSLTPTLSATAANEVDDLVLGSPTRPHHEKRWRSALLAAAVMLLCTSTVVITLETRPPAPPERAAHLAAQLHAAGLTALRVEARPEGVVVSGLLDDEAQRIRLWDMARNLLYRVQLEVAVRSDVLHAVKAAFNSRGIYPEVTFMPAADTTPTTPPLSAQAMPKAVPGTPDAGTGLAQSPDTATTSMAGTGTAASGVAGTGGNNGDNSDGKSIGGMTAGTVPAGAATLASAPLATPQAKAGLRVAGYMRDGVVEAWAFDALREDVPQMPHVTRDLRYASQVAPVLDPLLADAGLKHVQTRYLSGVVQLSGDLDAAQREALDTVLAQTRTRLQVDIPFEVVQSAPAPDKKQQEAPAPVAGRGFTPARHEAAAPAQAEGPQGIDVRSVTLTPLRFVTTGDGQRIFEGGMLPGGYVVESISTTELHLRKDGRSTIYRLRGSHD